MDDNLTQLFAQPGGGSGEPPQHPKQEDADGGTNLPNRSNAFTQIGAGGLCAHFAGKFGHQAKMAAPNTSLTLPLTNMEVESPLL